MVEDYCFCRHRRWVVSLQVKGKKASVVNSLHFLDLSPALFRPIIHVSHLPIAFSPFQSYIHSS